MLSTDPYADLERFLTRMHLIGRPSTFNQWMVKIVWNLAYVVNIVRFTIIAFFPQMSEENKLLVGNLIGALGYNNSMMFLVTLSAYGIITVIYMILFGVAEYTGKKEFLDHTLHLEDKMTGWNLCPEDEAKIKWVTRLILKLYKYNIVIAMISTGGLVAVALVIRVKEAESGIEIFILISWFLFVSTFFPRIATTYYVVLLIQIISVYAHAVRYAALKRRLMKAKREADVINFMDEHHRISVSCKSHNSVFKWMIAAVTTFSMPAAAITVYGVIYTDFKTLFELTNGIVFCILVTVCTLVIVVIPSGTARQAQSSYNAAMSCMVRIKMSRSTRHRLLILCKRISRKTVGEIGFSNGNTITFDQIEAYDVISSMVNMWFLYASMRLDQRLM